MADFQVTGNIRIPNAASYLMRNQNNNTDFTALSSDSSGNLLVGHASMPRINFATGPIIDFPGIVQLATTSVLGWGPNRDVGLWRDGQWELGLRDGLNDMFFYVYGTFTDASNYERLALYAGSSVNHFIESQAAGTGDANINLTVRAGGSGILTLGRQSNGQIQLQTGFLTQVLQDGASQTTRSLEAVISTTSGASVTASNLIPSNCLLLAVTLRVLTAITGPTGFDIGDGVDVDRWGASIPGALNTTSTVASYTSTALTYFPTANDVVLTSDGVDFTGGSVRVTVHFMTFGPPTS